MFLRLFILSFLSALLMRTQVSFASEGSQQGFQSGDLGTEAPSSAEASSWFSTQLIRRPTEERNPFWFPFLSFALPGFDQVWEKQYRSGLTYAAGAYAGTLITINARNEIRQDDDDNKIEGAGDFDETDDRLKRIIFGSSLYQFMGSMSSYHSFRSAVRSYHASGSHRFAFLKETIDEDTGDLLLAPFELSYVREPSTWVPLAMIGGLVAYDLSRPEIKAGEVTLSEGAFLSGISYHAGVGEEALFRGWVFPYLYDGLESYFWANAIQSTIFASLHMTSSYRFPVYQFAFGWYAGYLAKKNRWSLKQAVFIHTWWDVIAFTALFLNENTRDQAQIRVPLLQTSF